MALSLADSGTLSVFYEIRLITNNADNKMNIIWVFGLTWAKFCLCVWGVLAVLKSYICWCFSAGCSCNVRLTSFTLGLSTCCV